MQSKALSFKSIVVYIKLYSWIIYSDLKPQNVCALAVSIHYEEDAVPEDSAYINHVMP